jgi:predicted ArsR family transcriptional regulator
VQIVDNDVAVSAEMTKEKLVQEMIRISSIGRPALMYQISGKRRGHRHRRQQG